MKLLHISKYTAIILSLGLLFSVGHAQEVQYLQLKERYIGGEIEGGLIMNEPAYSIGFGAGRVQDEHLQVGLSLHFLVNNITRPRADGNEELRKLNLLGLETQFYRSFSNSFGYYGTLGLHIGTAELNKLSTPNSETWNGFTGALKPNAGLFYKMNKRSELYCSIKYMWGLIFDGTKTYHGVPLVSFGVRFREVGF